MHQMQNFSHYPIFHHLLLIIKTSFKIKWRKNDICENGKNNWINSVILFKVERSSVISIIKTLRDKIEENKNGDLKEIQNLIRVHWDSFSLIFGWYDLLIWVETKNEYVLAKFILTIRNLFGKEIIETTTLTGVCANQIVDDSVQYI